MSLPSDIFEPAYSGSHALIIGINKYLHVNPLARAVDDAKAVAMALVDNFGFPKANVTLLTDEKATRAKIMGEYLSFSKTGRVAANDRLLVFFAGHGHTVGGRRETGFLVPSDGDVDSIETLIRWDELTRNADLIPAKHILFLMDACYGGLAVTRKIPSGSSRYLEDMLTRVARQVVTAGKADETVSDGGGTRPNHSIFTSYLLDALDGAAENTPGIITAMGVMAYVYNKVGNDPNSQQTPHFGFIEGDGDFIFKMPTLKNEETKGHVTLIKEPQFSVSDEIVPLSVGDKLKTYIPDPSARIKLDDLVSDQLRNALQGIDPTKYPAQGIKEGEINITFAEYVRRYEKEIRNLEAVLIHLCRWADQTQLSQIHKIMEGLGDSADNLGGGYATLLRLHWYPVGCTMYAGGISAIAANRFDTLRACMLTEVRDPQFRGGALRPIILPVGYALAELQNDFKRLPELDRRYAARSDYMQTALQSVVEDEMFLGRRYEEAFDKFEIMLALVFADIRGKDGNYWGPPGSFGWKENRFNATAGPLGKFVEDAKKQGEKWPALKAGFFNGSAARFAEVADGFRAVISSLNWF